MASFFTTFSSLAADGGDDADHKVEIGDIEAQLRALTSSAQAAIAEGKTNVIVAGVVGTVSLIAAAYLHGRRRGRRRASVLEIRRI
jgi:hypothetical protein